MADNSNNLQLLRVNHSIKMTEAFESMFLDESLCDITIGCGGHSVKAHRVILAASSSYFRQILSSINGQTQYPIVIVDGIQMSDLSAMLEFMYRGEVTIPHSQLSSLIKSAELLGVSGLCQLDPNAQNLNDSPQDKSRTSSPTDSTGGPPRRGRKRKKLHPKPENERNNEMIGSDSEHASKNLKNAEECDESEDLDTSDAKTDPSEKLAKSKLRSWTQQIAMKANHKDAEESPQMSNDDERTANQMIAEDMNQSEPSQANESAGSPQIKKHIIKHSRARRVPLKYSEYTLPKGINEVKQQIVDKNETQTKDTDGETDDPIASGVTLSLRPPSPRLTRGRSRVHSVDDPKDSKVITTPSKEDPMDIGMASTSTSADGGLTPNTRSRKQTFSPSDGKPPKEPIPESSSQQLVGEKVVIKSEDESSQNSQSSQVRPKASPVKPQISTLPSSSLIKWRPKDPQLTTTKFTSKVRSSHDSSQQQLNYQYEAVEEDGPPVYRCSYCHHSFRSKQNIIDHIRSVHIKSEERYVCPLCHKQFKWKTSLNNHLNQMHPLSRPTPLRHFDKTRRSLP
ncbi:unnamed protein product [Oppiella nova]|uniref:Uncharacterized protein n=1 Tax=Oppiella nova TaxID=334625 RepID=A0A7R9LMJ1_9ACAR|nr:unnamed protein product [Oppiella nova]CAG2165120.1 unnamed protein product [Oppiella nova]